MYCSEVSTKTRVTGRTTGGTVSTRPVWKQADRHISYSGVNKAYLLPKRWWDVDGNEKAKWLYLISVYRSTLVYDDRKNLGLDRLRTIVRKYGPYREFKFIEDQCCLVRVVILARWGGVVQDLLHFTDGTILYYPPFSYTIKKNPSYFQFRRQGEKQTWKFLRRFYTLYRPKIYIHCAHSLTAGKWHSLLLVKKRARNS